MLSPEQIAFARRHWRWLVPVFVFATGWGLLRGNVFALIGGILGLAWIWRALRRSDDG